jgi:hypothetical protein
VQGSTPGITRDSEEPLLPLEAPEIEAARELFLPKDDEPADIMKIIQACLKNVKRHNSKQAIKKLSLLISVSEYIKLCARYKTIKTCKKPFLNSSLAIARRMGRGPYYARQIRDTELQWVKKLSQCLAVLERLTCRTTSKLHNNLKIIYEI